MASASKQFFVETSESTGAYINFNLYKHIMTSTYNKVS